MKEEQEDRFTAKEREAQKLYWKFTVWNRGYEWVDLPDSRFVIL